MYAGTALKDENKRDHKKVIIQIATCYMRLANNKCQSYAYSDENARNQGRDTDVNQQTSQ